MVETIDNCARLCWMRTGEESADTTVNTAKKTSGRCLGSEANNRNALRRISSCLDRKEWRNERKGNRSSSNERVSGSKSLRLQTTAQRHPQAIYAFGGTLLRRRPAMLRNGIWLGGRLWPMPCPTSEWKRREKREESLLETTKPAKKRALPSYWLWKKVYDGQCFVGLEADAESMFLEGESSE